jgi:hypothetical protein
MTLLPLSLAAAISLSAPARRQLAADAKQLGSAVLRNDVEGQLKRMHPALVQGLGGPEKAAEILRRQPEEMKKEGGSILSVAASEPAMCARVSKQLQCVLPQKMVIAADARRFQVKSEMLAISNDEGKSWFFASVPGDDKDFRRALNVSPDLTLHGNGTPELLP